MAGECRQLPANSLTGWAYGFSRCEFVWPNLTEIRLAPAFGFCPGKRVDVVPRRTFLACGGDQ